MCNWLKSLFGKKCHCEGGCCGEKKSVSDAPKVDETEKTTPVEVK